jgi:hypothetical protein
VRSAGVDPEISNPSQPNQPAAPIHPDRRFSFAQLLFDSKKIKKTGEIRRKKQKEKNQ